MIPVVIVEDATDYLDILRLTIDAEEDMRVEAVFANAESYCAALASLHARVVIMDINLPGASGIEAVVETRRRRPGTEIIMCTVFDDDEKVFASFRAGAGGDILKSTPMHEILEAIREMDRGGAPMTPKIARKVLGVFQPVRPQGLDEDGLSPRESEILYLLGQGKTYQAVCESLFISYGTVQSHVKSIYHKLQVHSKNEIISWLANRRGKRDPGGS